MCMFNLTGFDRHTTRYVILLDLVLILRHKKTSIIIMLVKFLEHTLINMYAFLVYKYCYLPQYV